MRQVRKHAREESRWQARSAPWPGILARAHHLHLPLHSPLFTGSAAITTASQRHGMPGCGRRQLPCRTCRCNARPPLGRHRRRWRKRPGGIFTTMLPFCFAAASISSSVRILSNALNTHLTVAGQAAGVRQGGL